MAIPVQSPCHPPAGARPTTHKKCSLGERCGCLHTSFNRRCVGPRTRNGLVVREVRRKCRLAKQLLAPGASSILRGETHSARRVHEAENYKSVDAQSAHLKTTLLKCIASTHQSTHKWNGIPDNYVLALGSRKKKWRTKKQINHRKNAGHIDGCEAKRLSSPSTCAACEGEEMQEARQLAHYRPPDQLSTHRGVGRHSCQVGTAHGLKKRSTPRMRRLLLNPGSKPIPDLDLASYRLSVAKPTHTYTGMGSPAINEQDAVSTEPRATLRTSSIKVIVNHVHRVRHTR